MKKPVIGITTGVLTDPRGVMKAGCPIAYVRSIVRAGGAPILLPAVDDPAAIASMMRSIHGLLLSGGGDIDARVYGEQPHPNNKRQDHARDKMELEAIGTALEMGTPIFGICRGIQTLNVALSGTLVQDIPTQVTGACKHYVREGSSATAHNIDIDESSLLARVLATGRTSVNSRHHQAVRDLGEDLQVNCTSRDGVIEGIEAADGRPILAVQCHPEDCADRYPMFQKLFDWLVDEAGKNRG